MANNALLMRFRYNKNILISTTLAYLTDLAALWRESVRVPDLQPDVLRPSASPRLLALEESAPFSAMKKKNAGLDLHFLSYPSLPPTWAGAGMSSPRCCTPKCTSRSGTGPPRLKIHHTK